MKEKDIVYESGDYWAKRVPNGFEVYRSAFTHSTRCARIGFKGEEGMRRVKAEIERRQAND